MSESVDSFCFVSGVLLEDNQSSMLLLQCRIPGQLARLLAHRPMLVKWSSSSSSSSSRDCQSIDQAGRLSQAGVR